MENKHENTKTSTQSLYLPASILLATILISASMFVVGSDISTSLSGLSKTLNNLQTGTGQQAPDNGTLVAAPGDSGQPNQSAEIKALLDGAAGTLGSSSAPIVLIEYSDYQCPFCRKWFNDSKEQLDKEYIETGKVQLIYKDFPLNFHPMAPTYAEAARCAGDEGKYWEMHDKIFDEQNKFGQGTISNLTKDDVKKWAQDLGMNTSAFNSCLDSGKYTSAVQANFNEGGQVGVSGTPSFVIGKRDGTGQLIVGAQPYSVFKSAIDGLINQ